MAIVIDGTTGISGVDGSASAPALEGSDTNTGIFFPAADTVAIASNGTNRLQIGPAGQWGIGATYGSSGEVLTSGGASAAPTWASPTGRLIEAPQILTANGTYTTPVGCTSIYVELVGGGGGGAVGSVTTNNRGGGGGGAGAYAAAYFSVTGNTSYTYAIGLGGGSAAAGGNTTFTVGATTVTAGGGAVGGAVGGTSTPGAGGAGGTATNGDINARGGSGGAGTVISGTTLNAAGGQGGASFFGSGGAGGLAGAGNAGLPFGSGGGGSGNAAGAGGSGANGVIRVWEFT